MLRPSQVILVLGPHRSGTSALTGVLGLLGCVLPRKLAGPAASNELGHFEPIAITDLHDEILREAGSRWDDWSPLPAHWPDDSARHAILGALTAEFLDDYPGPALAVLKDPRICRLLPLWRAVFERLGVTPFVLLTYRHPIEVARSLRFRDRCTLGDGLRIWLRNQLEAEAGSRGLPRAMVSFEGLLADWRLTLERVERQLGLTLPGGRRSRETYEVDGFLRGPLRHERADGQELAEEGELGGLAAAALALLDRLVDDPGDAAAMQGLDALRLSFDATAAPADPTPTTSLGQ